MLLVGLTAIACSSEPTTTPVRDRMLALQRGLDRGPLDPRTQLSDADLDLVEAAGVQTSRLVGSDIADLVEVLRFGANLDEGDWSEAADFASSESGRGLAWPMTVLAVGRGDMDAAARLAIASVTDAPSDNRAYSLWKRWEYLYGARDDYASLSQGLTSALLRRGEQGSPTDRQVVADLFGVEDLTPATITELRARIEQSARERAAVREHELSLLQSDGPIWIEDRKGMRRVQRTPSLDIEHWECRLGAALDGQPVTAPWGTLVAIYGDSVRGKAAVLRAIAAAGGEDLTAFGDGVGPIARVRRPSAVADPFAWPIHRLDSSMTSALGAGGFALTLAKLDSFFSDEEREAGHTHAQRALAVVRRAAARMRALTASDRTEDVLDEAGDERLLTQLDEVTRAVAAWAEDALRKRTPPADSGSWNDMYFEGARSSTSRTLVRLADDTLSIFEVASREGASDVPGTYRSVSVQRVRRDELEGASYEVEGRSAQSDAGATLTIKLAKPIDTLWLSLPPAGCSRSQLTSSGDSSVRLRGTAVIVPCDTEQHAQEVARRVRAFAGEEGR